MNSINLAKWITADIEPNNDSCRMFQRTIKFEKQVKKAVLNITALGLYEAFVNGKRVGKDYRFLPGWTHYNRRVQYQSFDVTKNIIEEYADISVYVARGWFSGHIAGDPDKLHFALACSLDVVYVDETKDSFISCASDEWKAAKTSIVFSDIYDGETYDARIKPYDFKPVRLAQGYNPNDIVLQQGEYVKEHEQLSVVKLIITPKNERVLDFGQNITGYVRFKVKAKKGERFILSHAEVLDNEGNFYIENLRGAKQKIEYISNGGKSEYSPHFSFQGFRYVRLDEWQENVNISDFKAIVVHSDMKRTGYFESSNKMLNKLYENTIWGQKGNFLDVPTDCPQRDERLGWTGDAQVFCKAASYNYDVKKFFSKWLTDLSLCQAMNGAVPSVIPVKYAFTNVSSAWGDAATIVPYQMYLTYNDISILEDQYESMASWVEYIKNSSDNPYLWDTGYQYGDWLALDVPFGTYRGKTNQYLIATIYYANSVDIMKKTAVLLKKKKKVIEYYQDLYDNIKMAFNETYWKDEKLITDTQTSYVLALHFNMLNEERQKKAIANLVERIHDFGDKISTGFLGTPYILHVLAEYGYADLAYKLLLEKEYPSWMYPITKGATTIWEHWDNIKPDGTFWSKDMNSFNHYAYGSVVDFMYEKVAGIRIDESKPGFSNIILKPVITKGCGLNYAKASLITKKGTIISKWEMSKDSITYTFVVPKNTTATICLKETYNVGPGEYTYTENI